MAQFKKNREAGLLVRAERKGGIVIKIERC